MPSMDSSKVAGIGHKKTVHDRCFLVNFAKFYTTLFLQNISVQITSKFLAILVLVYNKLDKRKPEA